jgi:NADH-quinone oxidoreductase subunit M
MFQRHPLYAVIGASGVVLGAWYLLTMLQHAFFGPLKEPHGDEHPPVSDISCRELLALGPIAALCLWLGVFPGTVVELIRPDVAAVAALYPPDGVLPTAHSVGATPAAGFHRTLVQSEVE